MGEGIVDAIERDVGRGREGKEEREVEERRVSGIELEGMNTSRGSGKDEKDRRENEEEE